MNFLSRLQFTIESLAMRSRLKTLFVGMCYKSGYSEKKLRLHISTIEAMHENISEILLDILVQNTYWTKCERRYAAEALIEFVKSDKSFLQNAANRLLIRSPEFLSDDYAALYVLAHSKDERAFPFIRKYFKTYSYWDDARNLLGLIGEIPPLRKAYLTKPQISASNAQYNSLYSPTAKNVDRLVELVESGNLSASIILGQLASKSEDVRRLAAPIIIEHFNTGDDWLLEALYEFVFEDPEYAKDIRDELIVFLNNAKWNDEEWWWDYSHYFAYAINMLSLIDPENTRIFAKLLLNTPIVIEEYDAGDFYGGYVLQGSIEAFCRIMDENDEPFLKVLVTHPTNESIAGMTLHILGRFQIRIDSIVETALQIALDSERNWRIRASVIRYLGQVGDKAVLASLQSIPQKSNPSLQSVLNQAIQDIQERDYQIPEPDTTKRLMPRDYG